MVWRNHIYNIIINAFGPIKELAPHLHQLGYRWAASGRGRHCTCRAAMQASAHGGKQASGARGGLRRLPGCLYQAYP